MKEHLSPLQKKLLRFAITADQINTALRNRDYGNLTADDRSLLVASDQLRQYLSMVARKAQRVASCLGYVDHQKKKKAA